jgi:Uri superfamily endonuclease
VRFKTRRLALRERRKTRRNRRMRRKTEPSHEKASPEARPGTYVLVLSSASDAEIRVGRHGCLRPQPGLYVYVGSALGPGGVRTRVNHHLRDSPRPHWHIDYLRPHATVVEVWLCYGRKRREHLWARFLSSRSGVSVPMPGFGSSDCNCESHLFLFASHAMRGRIRSSRGSWTSITVSESGLFPFRQIIDSHYGETK